MKTIINVKKHWKLIALPIVMVLVLAVIIMRIIQTTQDDARPLDIDIYLSYVDSKNPARIDRYVESKNQITVVVDSFSNTGYGITSRLSSESFVHIELSAEELEEINIGDIVTIRGKMSVTGNSIFMMRSTFGSTRVEAIEHSELSRQKAEVCFDAEVYSELYDNDNRFFEMINYIKSINTIKGVLVDVENNYWVISLGSLPHSKTNILIHMDGKINLLDVYTGDNVEVKVSNVCWTGATFSGEGYFLMADNGIYVKTLSILDD